MEIAKPALIEPGVKYFLKETLKRCHTFKESHNIFILNMSLFAGFLVILGVVLLLTNAEISKYTYVANGLST